MRRLAMFPLLAFALVCAVLLCTPAQSPAQVRAGCTSNGIASCAGPGPPPDPQPCSRKGSRTVRSDSEARVYAVGDKVFGCLYSKNKPYLLGGGDCDSTGLGGIAGFRLVGRYVAYSATTCNIDQAKAHVRVRNLRTGAKPIVVDASPSFRDMLEIGGYFVSDLELKVNGSVAWIVKLDAEGLPRTLEVRKTDGTVAMNVMGFRDQSVLLDSGDQIGSGSLTLNGPFVGWANGGMTKSASVS